MAIWRKNSHFAILALFSRASISKFFFCQMTSGWVLWKTYCTLLLKKCLRPCPGLSMYLSEKINWIISSFPHRISKILFYLAKSLLVEFYERRITHFCWKVSQALSRPVHALIREDKLKYFKFPSQDFKNSFCFG